MRPLVRRPGAFLLALLLAVPPVGSSQAPPEETEGAVEEEGGSTGLAGSWVGGATLTNDWPGHRCRYVGRAADASVHLELSAGEVGLEGSVAIDVPPAEDSDCPPLRKRFLVTEVITAQGVVSLTDSGGHEWDLSLVRNGRALQGMMAWQQGASDEPLAQGFSFPDGAEPRSRLSGEVRLRKARPDAEEEETASNQSTGGGDHMKHLGAVLGATAVGLGALYGVNKLGQGSSEEGTVTCSPRRCVVGAPGEPCFCEGNVVSGADCGDTETGVPIEGMCVWPNLPCQALLSCNSGLCEDRFGRCPFN